jgi:hypothetical protein
MKKLCLSMSALALIAGSALVATPHGAWASGARFPTAGFGFQPLQPGTLSGGIKVQPFFLPGSGGKGGTAPVQIGVTLASGGGGGGGGGGGAAAPAFVTVFGICSGPTGSFLCSSQTIDPLTGLPVTVDPNTGLIIP